jgi:hypothetical protein
MAILIFAIGVGCTRSYPVGRLSVQVIDDNNAPIGGVAADLFKITPTGRVHWRASRTTSTGVAVLGEKSGIIEGEYVIHITLTPWQKLAAGESNDRPVKVRAGDNTIVTFRLQPRLPVRPSLRSGP